MFILKDSDYLSVATLIFFPPLLLLLGCCWRFPQWQITVICLPDQKQSPAQLLVILSRNQWICCLQRIYHKSTKESVQYIYSLKCKA